MTTQSQSDNMLVAVRIRPLALREVTSGARKCCKVIGNKIVVIAKAGVARSYLRTQQGSINEYQFDAAFDAEASQAEVYEHTAKPHVPAVLEGHNVTIVAYGATGAGKTYTMMGSEQNGDRMSQCGRVSGIIPQSLVDIFRVIQEKRGRRRSPKAEWQVAVSYLEVYNEQIYDLISPGRHPIQLREDSQKGVVQVSGLSEVPVQDTNEVLNILRQGNNNRKTESTAANAVSSRSHAVLQVSIRLTTTDSHGHDLIRDSKLSLIDLAGSERASATANRGVRLQEGANINKSLLALANCFNALAENGTARSRRNVKYRDSKLTHLLKTSLEGDCRLVMIANVNPCDSVFEDSHNTIKYANRAKQIKIKPCTTQVKTQEIPWHEREARLLADNEAMRLELLHLRSLLEGAAKPSDLHGDQAFAHSSFQSDISGASFLTIEDGIDADDGALSISQDTADRRISRGGTSGRQSMTARAAGIDQVQLAAARVQELERIVIEMTRTRQCMQQWLNTLEVQKEEKEEQLQAQQQLHQDAQEELREREQQVQSLREIIVHLHTRLDAAGLSTAQMGSSSAAAAQGIKSMAAKADSVLEALDTLISPIRAKGEQSMTGGQGGTAERWRNPTLDLESAERKPFKRRQSQIPRPPCNYMSRRNSIIPPSLPMEKAREQSNAEKQRRRSTTLKRPHEGTALEEKENNEQHPSKLSRPDPPIAGLKKSTGLPASMSNQSASGTRRRDSLRPVTSHRSIIARRGVADRTRSRMSLVPGRMGSLLE